MQQQNSDFLAVPLNTGNLVEVWANAATDEVEPFVKIEVDKNGRLPNFAVFVGVKETMDENEVPPNTTPRGIFWGMVISSILWAVGVVVYCLVRRFMG